MAPFIKQDASILMLSLKCQNCLSTDIVKIKYLWIDCGLVMRITGKSCIGPLERCLSSPGYLTSFIIPHCFLRKRVMATPSYTALAWPHWLCWFTITPALCKVQRLSTCPYALLKCSCYCYHGSGQRYSEKIGNLNG